MLIGILHPYLESRRSDLLKKKYPHNHLWGVDALNAFDGWKTRNLSTHNFKSNKVTDFFLDKSIFKGSPGSNVEFSALTASFQLDLIYSVCGPLALSTLYPQKLISWVFGLPPIHAKKFIFAHRAYRPKNLESHAGFLCLTPKAEEYYSQFAPSKFIPWCVDMELFDGKPPREEPVKPFFIATGKTYRDYKTLVKAANETNADIRIIGPKFQKPDNIPKNVKWIDTSCNPPDQAIDYPTLKEWYAQCSGVCIPLSGDAEDTCGYTNMLEGMAMRKPLIMTRSGCLHIDPASRNFGIQVEPRDSQGWSHAMNQIILNKRLASEWGENGRKIAEKEFSIERFNRDVISFIREIIELSARC